MIAPITKRYQIDRTLKTAPGPFRSIWRGLKKAEFRKNDWDAQVGDVVELIEHDGTKWIDPWRQIIIRITHIVHGGKWGIPAEYMMFSFDVLLKRAAKHRHIGHRNCEGC